MSENPVVDGALGYGVLAHRGPLEIVIGASGASSTRDCLGWFMRSP